MFENTILLLVLFAVGIFNIKFLLPNQMLQDFGFSEQRSLSTKILMQFGVRGTLPRNAAVKRRSLMPNFSGVGGSSSTISKVHYNSMDTCVV